MEQTGSTGRGLGAAGRAGGVRVPEGYFERVRAPFTLRCGALLIDYTLLAALLAFVTLLARVFGGEHRWAGVTLLTLGYVVTAAVAVLNFVVLASLSGRTVGKWVTGLRVERVTGAPPGLARILFRHTVGYLMTLATGGLGFLIAALSAEGRALHDLLAGTVVVRGRGRGRGAARTSRLR